MTRALRALSLAFALVHGATVLVLSVPPPPRGLRGDAPNRQSDEALAAWVSLADDLGLPAQQVDATMRALLPAWSGLLDAIQAPLRPYADLVGARQSWRMFGVVPDRVTRIEIDAQVDGGAVPLYRAPSPPAGAPRDLVVLMRQERVRTLVAQLGSRSQLPRLESLARVLAARLQRPIVVRISACEIPDPSVLRETGALRCDRTRWEIRR